MSGYGKMCPVKYVQSISTQLMMPAAPPKGGFGRLRNPRGEETKKEE